MAGGIEGKPVNAAKQLGSQAAKLDNSVISQAQQNDTVLSPYCPIAPAIPLQSSITLLNKPFFQRLDCRLRSVIYNKFLDNIADMGFCSVFGNCQFFSNFAV